MLFNSYIFIFVFLPVSLIVHFFLGNKRPLWCIPWLIVSSLFFYSWWSFKHLPIILISIGVNYLIAQALSRHQNKLIYCAGLIFNLMLIIIFKYTDFILMNIAHVVDLPIAPFNWVLPLAISFFTFQQIAFLSDCYQGKIKSFRFLPYTLFVVFFPQLIAGPIVQYHQIVPQIEHKKFSSRISKNIAIGLSVFIIGLFKKVMIADFCAPIANAIFNAAEAGTTLSFFEGWGGMIAYTLQLYFDFSGYCDMAIGLSLLFNIKLPINFNSPYKARNIIDFWHRWHITLSSFLRDYLYIPLGGNRKGTVRRYINLIVTMLLGGIWHGANWNFVIWGGLHGFYLAINHLWRGLLKYLKIELDQNVAFKLFSHTLTLLCVMFAWVFFRAKTFTGAINLFKAILGLNGISLLQSIPHRYPALAQWLGQMGLQFNGLFINELADLRLATFFFAVLWLVVLILPYTQQLVLNRPFPKAFPDFDQNRIASALTWDKTRVWALFIGLLGLVSVLWLAKASDFIYYQF